MKRVCIGAAAIAASALFATTALAGAADDFIRSGNGNLNRYDYRAAISDFDQALDADPGNVMALNGRCWARAVWNANLSQALDDCNKALYKKPYYAAALNSRGFVHFRMGAFQDAIDDYTRAIKLSANNASSYYMRGLAYLKLGDKMKAKFDIDQAKSLDFGIANKYIKYGIQAPPPM